MPKPFEQETRYNIISSMEAVVSLAMQVDAGLLSAVKGAYVGITGMAELAAEAPFCDDPLLHDLFDEIWDEEDDGSDDPAESYEATVASLKRHHARIAEELGGQSAANFRSFTLELARRTVNAAGGGLLGLSSDTSAKEQAWLERFASDFS